MFKIEKRIEVYKEDGNNFDLEICYLVNDKGVEVSPHVQRIDSNFFTIHFEEADETTNFSEFPITDFPSNVDFEFNYWTKIDEFDVHLEISCSTKKQNVSFDIVPKLPFWSEPYSFADYQTEFHTNLEKQPISFFPSNNKYKEFSMLCIFTTHEFSSKSIRENLSEHIKILTNVHVITKKKLKLNFYHSSIISVFNFPEGLKIPCEQYLLYFAQFLQDLGINATSNLKEEAGKVLFSVTPTDDIEALDKIREALAVYLNLPSSPIVYDESFAAMRLKAEIERFHHSQRMTQLELQSTGYALKLAHKSIEDLQMVNQLQKEHIERIKSPTVIIDSLENKDEFEKVFEGLEFGESKELKEKLGIKFNPAKLLKSLLKSDDEIISLKINE
jgi:hypothetical protein